MKLLNVTRFFVIRFSILCSEYETSTTMTSSPSSESPETTFDTLTSTDSLQNTNTKVVSEREREREWARLRERERETDWYFKKKFFLIICPRLPWVWVHKDLKSPIWCCWLPQLNATSIGYSPFWTVPLWPHLFSLCRCCLPQRSSPVHKWNIILVCIVSNA